MVEENVSIEGFEGVFLGKEVEEEQNLLDERVRKIGLRRRVRRAHRVVDELDELLGESEGVRTCGGWSEGMDEGGGNERKAISQSVSQSVNQRIKESISESKDHRIIQS